MRLRDAVQELRNECPDLALALTEMLPHDSPGWEAEIPDDLWRHDAFEDPEEEYRFLRGVITGGG